MWCWPLIGEPPSAGAASNFLATRRFLPDGTVSLVYQDNNGLTPDQLRQQSLWGIRVAIHDDASGIDILSAPGSPTAGRGR
jgi:hypothetical protein